MRHGALWRNGCERREIRQGPRTVVADTAWRYRMILDQVINMTESVNRDKAKQPSGKSVVEAYERQRKMATASSPVMVPSQLSRNPIRTFF